MKLKLYILISILFFSYKVTHSGNNDNPPITIVMMELDTNVRSYYTIQSNANIHYIYREIAHPDNIHVIFMTSKIPNTFDDRSVKYLFSSNGGNSWTYFGTIGATRSGFPSLSSTPDGRALITMHNTDGGGIQRCQLYAELISGSGSFTRLDPGVSNPANGNIWGVCAGTNTKAFIVCSQQLYDSVLVNTTSSLTSSQFIGWKVVKCTDGSPAGTAQQYSCAVGTGKWGITFIGANYSVYYTESTNEGATWSNSVAIRNYNPADSTGGFRFIDMLYEGPNQRVVFTTGKVTQSGVYSGLPSKLMFWAPDINGGNPVPIDSAGGATGSLEYPFSCCRGTIGKSNDGSYLYISYTKARTNLIKTLSFTLKCF